MIGGENTGKSYSSLITAFGVAVFVIYMVLAAQFRSYLQPVIIMSNIIFSFTGVVLTFKPGEGFEPGGQRPDVIKSLRGRLQGSTGSLLFCLLVGFLLNLLSA